MATIALQQVGAAVGTAFGGPIGGFIGGTIGGAVGGVIDQNYIFPAIFGSEQDVQGPRLDDQQIQSASEGSPINFFLGPENRVAGTLIWLGVRREIKRTTSSGGSGKGGGGGNKVKTSTYTYNQDIAIAWGEGPITQVKTIWANGKLIFDDGGMLAVQAQGTLTMDTQPTAGDTLRIGNRTYTFVTTLRALAQNEIEIGIDVIQTQTRLQGLIAVGEQPFSKTSGAPHNQVTMGGFVSNAAVITARKFGTSGNSIITTETFTASTNVFDAATLGTTTLGVDGEVIGKRFKSITNHLGGPLQAVDTLIEATEGTTNTPAFRNIAYTVLERLQLGDFGNRLPNLNGLLEKEVSTTVASALTQIIDRTGQVAAGRFTVDVTDVSDVLRGYNLAGPMPVNRQLETLLLAFDVNVRVSNNVLTFFDRDKGDTVTITESDLAAHESGSDAPRPFTITDQTDIELPSEVNVNFIEPDLDYQRGSQRARAINTVVERVRTFSFPIVFTPNDGREIAERLLWTARAERRRMAFQLPPSYLQMEEGDVVTVPADNETYAVRLTKVDRGNSFLLMLEGNIEQISSGTQQGFSQAPAGFTRAVYTADPVTLILMDIAPLRDEDVSVPGFYFAMAMADRNSQWRGAGLFESLDDTNFNQIQFIDTEVDMGRTLTTLASGTTTEWDHANSVDVEMFEGALSSESEINVYNGANFALIGNEIIGFQNAVLIAANTYRLSTLLRGRRNTEDAIDSHGPGETFVVLDPTTVNFRAQTLAAIGSKRFYRPVPTDDEVTNVVSYSITLQANSMRPFSPAHVDGDRDGSNNLTINWIRRTRALFRHFSTTTSPQIETTLQYEVDILDAPGGTVLRTITGIGTTGLAREETVYSAAQQTSDGLTPGDPVNVEVFQLSSNVGRSKPGARTI